MIEFEVGLEDSILSIINTSFEESNIMNFKKGIA